jgi:hypothetical protein
MDLTKFYINIDELPLYNFDKIETTNDLMWLYEDFNGRQPKADTTELNPIYEEIINQYFKAFNDTSLIPKYQKVARRDFLVLKYNIVLGIANRIVKGFTNTTESQETRAKFIEVLKKYSYNIPLINSAENDVKESIKIVEKLKSLNMQIILLEKELQKTQKTESVNLQQQMILVSKNLELGYKINAKETTVKEWIELIKFSKNNKNGK